MQDIVAYFGEWVRTERLRQGLSQEKLAEKAGVHRTYVGMVERAEKNVTLRSMEKIVSGLGMAVGDVFRNYAPRSECENKKLRKKDSE
jgi:transcriptional regulator with XRE-family HTH domain